MSDVRNSLTKRKSDLDLRNKFNQVFSLIETKDFDQAQSYLDHRQEQFQDKGYNSVENKMTPTFKMLSRDNSPEYGSSPEEYLNTRENKYSNKLIQKIGVFKPEPQEEQQRGQNSSHQMTYIDKLNEQDQVMMPFSQQQINSVTQLNNLTNYHQSSQQIAIGSEQTINAQLTENISINHQEADDQYFMKGTNVGNDHVQVSSQSDKNDEMERTLQFEEVKVLDVEEEMFVRDNEEMSEKIQDIIMVIEKQIIEEAGIIAQVIKSSTQLQIRNYQGPQDQAQLQFQNYQVTKGQAQMQFENYQVRQGPTSLQLERMQQSDSQQPISNKDPQSPSINDSFQHLKHIGRQLEGLSDDQAENQLNRSQEKLNRSQEKHKMDEDMRQQQEEDVISADEFFTDIRQVHLGVGKTIVSNNSSLVNSSPQRQQQQHPHQQFPDPNHEQTLFQSFNQDSTQFFDCNQLLNNSLSFTSNQNLLNRSLLSSSRHQVMDSTPDKQQYRVILQDVGEDYEEEVNLSPSKESPGKQQKRQNDMKSHEYLNLTDQDLMNFERLNNSHQYITLQQQHITHQEQHITHQHQHTTHSEQYITQQHLYRGPNKRQHQNKLLIISNMNGIFLQLLHQYKTHFSQFVYTLQQQLFTFKQSFVEQSQLLYSQLSKQLEFTKQQLKLRIKQDFEREYDQRLKEKVAILEEELAERENQWQKDMVKKIEKDLVLQYQEKYQNLVFQYEERYQNLITGVNINKMQYFNHNHNHYDYERTNQQNNQYQQQQSMDQQQQQQQQQRDQDQILQSYLNKQQEHKLQISNKILPAQISMFATTNELNEHYMNSSNVTYQGNQRNSHRFRRQTQNSLIKRQSRKHHQRQIESILHQLSMQNQSLCEQLMIQHEHTQIMNEQQVKYKQQIQRMNDLEDQLQEIKKENLYLKTYLFQLEEEKEQIRKLYEERADQGKEQRVKELENQLKLIIEGNCQLKNNNLRLQLEIAKLNDKILKLDQQLQMTKHQVTRLSDQVNQLKQIYSQAQQQLKITTVQNTQLQAQASILQKQLKIAQQHLNQKQQQLLLQKQSTSRLNERTSLLQAQITKLNLIVQQFSAKIQHHEQLQRISQLTTAIKPHTDSKLNTLNFPTQTNNHTSHYSSQQPSIILNLSRPSLRLSRASSQGSLINPLLNQHSLNTNNSIVNQILENMKHRKNKLSNNHHYLNGSGITNYYDKRNSGISNYDENRDMSFVQSSPNDNSEREQLNSNGNTNSSNSRYYNYASQEEIRQERTGNTTNQHLIDNSYRLPQNYHLAKSHLKHPIDQQTTNHPHNNRATLTPTLISQQPLAIHSPKSPSSTSIVSKKVSSSQKDKKMSIISLKLQKLRSDIKQEIKEISTITK